MARSAGTYTAEGILSVARSIKSLMDEEGIGYHAASSRMMIAADLIWWPDEQAAIWDAFAELDAEADEQSERNYEAQARYDEEWGTDNGYAPWQYTETER